MTHSKLLYGLALVLMVYSLFVLWVWTGPIGVIAAAILAHGLFRVCETRRDAEAALARKSKDSDLRTAFRR